MGRSLRTSIFIKKRTRHQQQHRYEVCATLPLRAYICKNSGLNFVDPFGSFKFSFDKVDRGYLNQDEIDLIYNKEFSSARLTQVRDMFIFSCYTGLSYIDLCNLTKEDIKLAFDGKLWIMIKREKTGVDSNVPLLEIPKQILAKYEGKMKGGKLLPVISNQKMNEYLGEIAEVCQIDKRITFHLARHTLPLKFA